MRQIGGTPKNLALRPTCFEKSIGVLFTEDGQHFVGHVTGKRLTDRQQRAITGLLALGA
jgi:hypothetical protein